VTSHDVVIVGGGAMGSATAYHLGLLAPDLDVAVVEKDPSYEHCSTLRSDGNLRVQFNLEENVRMSLYMFDLLDSFAEQMAIGDWRPDPAPRHHGNLFLSDEEGREAAQAGIDLQRSLGCDVEWLEPDEIAARWPDYRTSGEAGVVGGVFGPRDGPIDPTAVLEGLRRNAERLGATYLADEVVEVVSDGERVTGVRLASGEDIETGVVVNCAGGWSAGLAASAGVEIPVEPVMRTVYVVETPLDVGSLPSIFAPSGLYVLPESSSTSQIAWSTEDDPVGFDFTFRRRAFEEVVWPELVRVLPAFDACKVVGGWCGVYAMNTLDHNAILGEWPELPGLWLATGFSGHGFQHTPAMGRYLAECLTGQPVTLDLSRLGPKRILDGTPVREHAGRII
jgi:glycine/D-amino acid oxidase-like deaminating enzyme